MRFGLDLRGETFGRWTVVQRLGGLRWQCLCECGTVRPVLQRSLRDGKSQSCGCTRTRHGHSTREQISPTYWSWTSMLSRCHNPNASDFARYGGRGVEVCDRWRTSFEDFLADMGERPAGTTLERIDNDGDYNPGNCKWATAVEQQLNRHCTRKIQLSGAIVSLEEAARRIGRAKTVILKRVAEHGDALRPHSQERRVRRDRVA